MKPLRFLCLAAAAVISLTMRAQSWQSAWPGCSLTCTTTETWNSNAQDYNYTYSNYVWTDPKGNKHNFNGTSRLLWGPKRPISVDGPVWIQYRYPLTATSTDGQWRIVNALDTEGTVGIPGTVYPKFQVLSIIYAPPGHSESLGSTNTVDYSKSQSVGSSYSIAHTFGSNVTMTASLGASLGDGPDFGFGGSINAGFTYKVENDKTWSITREYTMDSVYPGPTNCDGVNHDYDLITLWLNPAIMTLQTSPTQAYWHYSTNPQEQLPPGWNTSTMGAFMDTIDVYLGELTGKIPMDASRALALSRSWNTTNPSHALDPLVDYRYIYALDPFWAFEESTVPGSAIDLNRFTLVPPQPQNGYLGYFNYYPAVNGIPPVTQTLGINYTNATTTKTTYTDEYTVGGEIHGGLFGLGASGSIQLTYTNERTEEISNSSTQSAKVAINPPGYASPQPSAPTRIVLYQDNIYGSYMFWGE